MLRSGVDRIRPVVVLALLFSWIGDILLILSENHSALPEMMASAMAERFAILGASGSDPVTSPLEARRLFDALMASENPEFTSSGKRILSILTAAEMEKRFCSRAGLPRSSFP